MRQDVLTPAQVAARHDCWVAMDKNGGWSMFESRPTQKDNYWSTYGRQVYLSHAYDIQWSGDWRDSLHEPPVHLKPCHWGHTPEVFGKSGEYFASCEYTDYEEYNGEHLLLGYFETKHELAAAWNAFVMTLTNEKK